MQLHSSVLPVSIWVNFLSTQIGISPLNMIYHIYLIPDILTTLIRFMFKKANLKISRNKNKSLQINELPLTQQLATKWNTPMGMESMDRIITIRLPIWMIHLDVCYGMPWVNQWQSVWSRGFVGTAEWFGFPICPVDVVFKQC